MGALAALAVAAAGCQATRFPVVGLQSETPAPSSIGSAISPVKLGTPMARMPAPEATKPTQSVWHPVQRDSRIPERAVAFSTWHQIQRAAPSAATVVAAKMPPAGNSAAARRDIIPVQLQTPPPGSQTPGKDAKPDQTPVLPAPRSVEVAAGPPVAGPLPDDAHGHPGGHVPRELSKTLLPPYIIEPPDVLLIETTEGLAVQPIRGPHLVRPDGTVSLGIYGSPRLAGLTLDQAREAIADSIIRTQRQGLLKQKKPKEPNKDEKEPNKDEKEIKIEPQNIVVDVLAYNSKFYYIITDGGGYGAQLYRLPITGNETVLDALSLINGLPPVASKHRIWLARRVPDHGGTDNILPVDWAGITQCGSAATNYQILPGDRLYVHSDRLIRLDTQLSKIITPIERLFGVTLLGSETVNSIRNRGTGTSP
jgi:polysaccharide export outer membrane protein